MKLLSPSHRSPWHFSSLIFFIIDLVVLFGCVMAAFRLSPSNPYEWSVVPGAPLYLQAIFLPTCMAFGLQLSDVQRLQARFRRTETFVRVLFGIGFGSLAFTLLHALIHFQLVGRYIIGISWILGVISISLTRMLLWRLARMGARSVLFWGHEDSALECADTVNRANLPLYLIGRYARGELALTQHVSRAERSTLVALKTPTSIGEAPLEAHLSFEPAQQVSQEELYQTCVRYHVDTLILSTPDQLSAPEKHHLTSLISRGLRVQTLNHFFERELERVHVASVGEAWLWDHEPRSSSPYYIGVKRLIDITLSLFGLVCAAPLFPFIAILIWGQDRGPIFYSQERLGLYGEPFQIYKFRTMRVDAEADGAQWAARGDSRVTWIGRALRKTRLDEIPQFFNILRGEMSFVGPRPEREEFVRSLEADLPNFRFRHLAKPGLSGWAQVNYGYGASVEDARVKLSYDLYYLKHASIALDLLIVLRTFGAMMRGAR